MNTRLALLALSALTLSVGLGASSACAKDDPTTVIRALYQAHQPWVGKELEFGNRVALSEFFGDELVDLLLKNAEIAKACPEGDLCGIDFDPIIAAQDFDEQLDFTLRIQPLAPPQVNSWSAHFKLFNGEDTEKVVVFQLTPSSAGWRIADINYPDLDTSLKAQLAAAQ